MVFARPEDADRYRTQCDRVFGWRPDHFLCPFTLDDSLGATGHLIEGHILPEALERSSIRGRAVQRGDVDNLLRLIDNEGAKFCNMPGIKPTDFMRSKWQKPITVENPVSGARVRGQYINPKGVQRDNPAIGHRLLIQPAEPERGVPTEALILLDEGEERDSLFRGPQPDGFNIRTSADFDGAMVNAAFWRWSFLLQFRFCGAHLLFDECFEYVRRPYAEFYASRGKGIEAAALFGHIPDPPTIVVTGSGADSLNTLETGYFLRHHFHGEPAAISGGFNINGYTVLVPLPTMPGIGWKEGGVDRLRVPRFRQFMQHRMELPPVHEAELVYWDEENDEWRTQGSIHRDAIIEDQPSM